MLKAPEILTEIRRPAIRITKNHIVSVDLKCFRSKQHQQIYLLDNPCLVWDFPNFMGFTDWLLASEISRNPVCASRSYIM